MMKHLGMIVLAVAVVAVLLLGTVAFTASSTDLVLVKTFERTSRVLVGSDEAQAGLHFKWPYPIQKVVRYDARTFILEDALSQLQTRDKKPLLVSLFCAWRIADPWKFDANVESVAVAEDRIRSLLADAKNRELPQYPLEAFVNSGEEAMKLDEIERLVREQVDARARESYGVEVSRVGIRTLGLPRSVTKDVVDNMIKERQRETTYYRASGEAQATAIRERARAAAQQILAFADAKASQIRSEGVSAAAVYYRQLAKNEPLSRFLLQVESLRKILKEKTVILLDPEMLAPLGWFSEGPPPGAGSSPATAPAPGPGRR